MCFNLFQIFIYELLLLNSIWFNILHTVMTKYFAIRLHFKNL